MAHTVTAPVLAALAVVLVVLVVVVVVVAAELVAEVSLLVVVAAASACRAASCTRLQLPSRRCARLALASLGGVQVSPPAEHTLVRVEVEGGRGTAGRAQSRV
jgi:hypothetical protein